MNDYAEALVRASMDIENALKTAPRDIREMTSHLAGAAGKAIRPRLLLACAMDDSGRVPDDAINLASAVEIFHMATLVHDDIIDDSPLRRGIPTVQSKFGKKRAVVCGDYLLCMAVDMVAGLPYSYDDNEAWLLPEFLSAAKKICIGEKNQSDNAGNLALSLRQYLKIISGKTAMLFYISSYAGALAANRGKTKENIRQIRALANFGRLLGIMFQIADDLKDYEQTEADALKPVRRDIADGVVTLPLILALAKNPGLKDLAAAAIGDEANVPKLIESVRANGGCGDAREIAARYRGKAERLLIAGTDDNEKRKKLLEILNGAAAWKK